MRDGKLRSLAAEVQALIGYTENFVQPSAGNKEQIEVAHPGYENQDTLINSARHAAFADVIDLHHGKHVVSIVTAEQSKSDRQGSSIAVCLMDNAKIDINIHQPVQTIGLILHENVQRGLLSAEGAAHVLNVVAYYHTECMAHLLAGRVEGCAVEKKHISYPDVTAAIQNHTKEMNLATGMANELSENPDRAATILLNNAIQRY